MKRRGREQPSHPRPGHAPGILKVAFNSQGDVRSKRKRDAGKLIPARQALRNKLNYERRSEYRYPPSELHHRDHGLGATPQEIIQNCEELTARGDTLWRSWVVSVDPAFWEILRRDLTESERQEALDHLLDWFVQTAYERHFEAVAPIPYSSMQHEAPDRFGRPGVHFHVTLAGGLEDPATGEFQNLGYIDPPILKDLNALAGEAVTRELDRRLGLEWRLQFPEFENSYYALRPPPEDINDLDAWFPRATTVLTPLPEPEIDLFQNLAELERLMGELGMDAAPSPSTIQADARFGLAPFRADEGSADARFVSGSDAPVPMTQPLPSETIPLDSRVVATLQEPMASFGDEDIADWVDLMLGNVPRARSLSTPSGDPWPEVMADHSEVDDADLVGVSDPPKTPQRDSFGLTVDPPASDKLEINLINYWIAARGLGVIMAQLAWIDSITGERITSQTPVYRTSVMDHLQPDRLDFQQAMSNTQATLAAQQRQLDAALATDFNNGIIALYQAWFATLALDEDAFQHGFLPDVPADMLFVDEYAASRGLERLPGINWQHNHATNADYGMTVEVGVKDEADGYSLQSMRRWTNGNGIQQIDIIAYAREAENLETSAQTLWRTNQAIAHDFAQDENAARQKWTPWFDPHDPNIEPSIAEETDEDTTINDADPFTLRDEELAESSPEWTQDDDSHDEYDEPDVDR